jgi:hypothetical protein
MRPVVNVRLVPLGQRILEQLPGPEAPWVVVWALVPWANAGANLLLDTATSAVWEQRRLFVILNYAALSLAVVVALWGSARLARQVQALVAEWRVTDSQVLAPFARMSGMAGPILATVATALVLGISAFVRDGVAAGVLRGTTWLIVGIPLWTLVWTYASMQLGLGRLGRARIQREDVVVDPGLGVLPLGAIAFTGLWLLLLLVVPILLTGLPDVAGVVLCLAVVAAGLAAFVLSLFGLHRQMVEVKAGELTLARELYAQAYGPVRAARTLEALDEQRSLLSAADSLEKRAHAIHDWPVKEGMWAWVIGIATSVVAIACARLILTPFGI